MSPELVLRREPGAISASTRIFWLGRRRKLKRQAPSPEEYTQGLSLLEENRLLGDYLCRGLHQL